MSDDLQNKSVSIVKSPSGLTRLLACLLIISTMTLIMAGCGGSNKSTHHSKQLGNVKQSGKSIPAVKACLQKIDKMEFQGTDPASKKKAVKKGIKEGIYGLHTDFNSPGGGKLLVVVAVRTSSEKVTKDLAKQAKKEAGANGNAVSEFGTDGTYGWAVVENSAAKGTPDKSQYFDQALACVKP